jgi:hypothetical protein
VFKELRKAAQVPFDFISRHAQGDWGDVDQEVGALNNEALLDGSRVLSAYTLRTGVKIWVLSEADRSVTTSLLPSEY